MISTPPPKLLTLADWAQQLLGNNAPSVGTLRRWAREGRISPQPVKYGKLYFCKPNAEYTGS